MVDAGLNSSDHPHACGENDLEDGESFPEDGPSPRVWGERKHCDALKVNLRTIPTRVGRTECADFVEQAGADHPHACGENPDVEVELEEICGPSPRVWGELRPCSLSERLMRTIPTRVGRTPSLSLPKFATTDHPHACGENQSTAKKVWIRGGPSPRVWGEPAKKEGRCRGFRTIPTRVGRT